MEEFASAAAIIALSVKLTDLGKYALAGNVRAAVTQIATWLAGILAVLLASSAGIAEGVELGGVVLDNLDFGSVVLLGVGLSSVGSVTYDVKRALDNTDSARTTSVPARPTAHATGIGPDAT